MSHGATYRADHITGSGGRAAVVQEFLNQQKKARKPGRLSYGGCLSSSMEAKKAANLKAEDRGPVFDSHLSRRRGRGSHSSRAFFVTDLRARVGSKGKQQTVSEWIRSALNAADQS
jgi:hypothetical protein